MNINRHNYEEFFLLYVDNELSAEQRAEVETFVQQNHDLAEELNMFMQATLLPEPGLSFDDKSSLYKTGQGIQLANCEEYFVLHLDNELSETEKEEVEKFVLQHPETQQAFTLLQQTKLQPEAVVFENKSILYRTAERKVVSLRWMRVAVAAALIGLVGLLWVATSNNNAIATDQGVAVQTKPNNSKPAEAAQPPVSTGNNEEPVAVNEQVKAAAQQAAIKKAVAIGSQKQQDLPKKTITEDVATAKNKAPVKPEPKPIILSNNLPERMINNDVIANNDKVKQEDNVVTPKPEQKTNTSRSTQNERANALTASSKLNEENNTLAKHTVYREVNLDNEEEDNSFLIGSAQINKNKLRGLFKKASTLIDKLSNKKENK